jgi:hypothetical protein
MVDGRPVAAEHNGHDLPNARPTKRARGTSPPPNGTDSTTPAKRSRVSRACDQCRASREKCDGVKPVCHTCDTQKRSCTYDEPPKKRGIQPNYIRTLELTLAWLFQTVPETQKALSRSLPIVNGPAQRCVILFSSQSITERRKRGTRLSGDRQIRTSYCQRYSCLSVSVHPLRGAGKTKLSADDRSEFAHTIGIPTRPILFVL